MRRIFKGNFSERFSGKKVTGLAESYFPNMKLDSLPFSKAQSAFVEAALNF
jgi:hypothetical protein